jgi:hypothetical protein
MKGESSMSKMVLVHDAWHGARCTATAAALRKMLHSASARAPAIET